MKGKDFLCLFNQPEVELTVVSTGTQTEAVKPVIIPSQLFPEQSVYYLALFLLQRFAKTSPFERAG